MSVIDFHSHVLPRIDDGSHSPEESLGMLQISASQGIDVMAATSHFYATEDRISSFYSGRAERRTGRQWIYGYHRLPARQGELLRNDMHSRRQTDCGGIKGRKYPHTSIDRGSAVRRDPPYHTEAGRTNGTTSYCRIIHPATCSRNPPRQRRRDGKKTQRKGRPHLPGNTFYIRMFFTEKQRSSSSPTMAFTNQRYA